MNIIVLIMLIVAAIAFGLYWYFTNRPAGSPAAPSPRIPQKPRTCPHRRTLCGAEYKPVCGVDNVTYGNACEAKRACVEVAYERMCPMSIR